MSSRRPKHPDWDKVFHRFSNLLDWTWLFTYIKTHDISQCTDEHGNTLLHKAVQLKDHDAIYNLTFLSIDPNIKNAAGHTPLQIASERSYWLLMYLRKCFVCIDYDQAAAEPKGIEALFAAIYRNDVTLGDTSEVKDNGNEIIDGEWSALQCAAIYNRPHMIRALHQRFPKLMADYTSQDFSALEYATTHGHPNCILALYECFPNLEQGHSLPIACERNYPNCIKALHDCYPYYSGNEHVALICAVTCNYPDCIRMLHVCYPDLDPNEPNKHGDTALLVIRKAPKCLPILYQCFPNIDPNVQNDLGNTALMYIVTQGLSNCVTQFATYFPTTDVNLCNKRGKTALMIAIEKNKEKCLIALCQAFPTIDPNIQDKCGNTALMLTSLVPNAHHITHQLLTLFSDQKKRPAPPPSSTRRLKSKGGGRASKSSSQQHHVHTLPPIDANIRNKKGETALMRAIRAGKAILVTLLLDNFPGVEFTCDEATGRTPLMMAVTMNKLKVILALLSHNSTGQKEDDEMR